MRVGLSVAFAAMLLQLAVFLQPLLPEEIRISLVCAMIAEIDLSRVNSPVGSAPFGQRQHNRLQQAVAVLGQSQPVHTAHLRQASFASTMPVIAVAIM